MGLLQMAQLDGFLIHSSNFCHLIESFTHVRPKQPPVRKDSPPPPRYLVSVRLASFWCLDVPVTASCSACFCRGSVLIPSLFCVCSFCVISLTVTLWIESRLTRDNLIESDSGLAATVPRAAPRYAVTAPGPILMRPEPRRRDSGDRFAPPRGTPFGASRGAGPRVTNSRSLFVRECPEFSSEGCFCQKRNSPLTAFPFQGFTHGLPLPPGSTASARGRPSASRRLLVHEAASLLLPRPSPSPGPSRELTTPSRQGHQFPLFP